MQLLDIHSHLAQNVDKSLMLTSTHGLIMGTFAKNMIPAISMRILLMNGFSFL